MPVTPAYGLRVTTDAASAKISIGDFLTVPPVPVSAFTAPTQAGRDTGEVDRDTGDLDRDTGDLDRDTGDLDRIEFAPIPCPRKNMDAGLTTVNDCIDGSQLMGN
jgi:hypothetical protein